ncbi:MAG: thioesterase II family protein [Pyrinomonadaceae bacterium]
MNGNRIVSPWLVRYGALPRPRLRLFCFPYAGGAAHVFRQWPQKLGPDVEICAVEPPGRGTQMREKPFMNLFDLVAAAAPVLAPYMDCPFAFFGHSMGAMISFELARHLRKTGGKEPAHLFLSGCRSPQLAHTRAVTYDLPEPEFVEDLRQLKGTPAEVLEHSELLQLMLPLLRADFAITQTYRYVEEAPLSCPLTIFGGLEDDEATGENLGPWRELTTGAFCLHMLPGDHFFLHTSQDLLFEIVRRELV